MNDIQKSIPARSAALFAIALCWLAPLPPTARAQGNNDGGGIITAIGNEAVIRSADGGRTWFVVSPGEAARAQGAMGRMVQGSAGASALRATLEGELVRLRFRLERPADVRIALAGMKGEIVASVGEGMMGAGDHTALLPVGRIPGGCYYCMVLGDGRPCGVKVLITR